MNSDELKIEVPKTLRNFHSRDFVGKKLFDKLACNIFLSGPTGSGKSVVIYNILKKCVGKKTKVIFFVGSIHNDPTYKEMLKFLDKNGNDYMTYTSMYDGKENILQQIEEELKQAKDDDGETKIPEPLPCPINLCTEKQIVPKKKKKKRKPPTENDYIFIFDDLSNEIRHSSALTAFLKYSRHLNCKCIISSQSLSDLTRNTRQQIHFLLLFRGLNDEAVKTVFEDINTTMSYKQFKSLYNQVVATKYNFLYVSRDGEFRRNFDQMIKTVSGL